MFKRPFWYGLLAGMAINTLLNQRRRSAMTQDRLDEYYRKRAAVYNLTDLFQPRVEMRKALIDMLDLKPGMRVLDFACGAGANFPFIMDKIGPTGQLVATDYSQPMLDAARQQFIVGKGWRNIELVQADAAEMSFDEPFDVVLCTMGLAVIPRWQDALQRGWELVRPGGVLGIGDLKESDRWYTLPIRWVTDLMDVLIIADSTRRPWEWMAKVGTDYRFVEVFHGYFYAARVRKV
jgi:ubiquinone/menaquinone biosynthesis C-methylase UbiE